MPLTTDNADQYQKETHSIGSNSLYKSSTRHNKILVLCIDRDDDIGGKAGMETPVVGRESCIDAGIKLAIEDPEDSDANAIFAAIKSYEELVSKGYNAEVALVAGKFNRGIEADEKVGLEIRDILSKYKADSAVLVSDGEDDEAVIKQSRSVEYSYAILGRYIKMLVFDPRYSKFFLGVPGALLVASGLATLLGLTKEAIAILLSILGSAFIIRAFDIDKALGSLGRPTPSTFIRIFSIFAGILIILVSIANGFSSIPTEVLKSNMSTTEIISNRVIVGSFAHGTITLLWIGIATILVGTLLSNWFRGSIRFCSLHLF